MKTVVYTVLFGLFVSGFAAQAESLAVKEIAVPVSGVFVPSGFDSKSDAYVVVNGLFPNSCYSLGDAKIENKSTTEHVVQTMAKVKQGLCIRVFVPFNKEISLGHLAKGDHTIRFISDDGTYFEKVISVLE